MCSREAAGGGDLGAFARQQRSVQDDLPLFAYGQDSSFLLFRNNRPVRILPSCSRVIAFHLCKRAVATGFDSLVELRVAS